MVRVPLWLGLICAGMALACSSPIQIPLLASPTPTATLTPTPSPTPTATPTPSPTPTPLPAARLEMGVSNLFLGDYELARAEYESALAAASEPEIQAQAALGIGKSYYFERNYEQAVVRLKSVLESYPGTSALAEAWYFLGESYSAQNDYTLAAEAFQHYLDLRPGILDGYIQEQRGDMLLAANDGPGAADAFQKALNGAMPGDPVWIRLKLAQALTIQKDFKGSVTLLLDIYQNSTNDYARAQADWLLGQAYTALGVPEQAQARYMDSVINFPASYDSYSGLVQLVNNGIQVSDLNRGIVDYYAGQYSLCVDALNRFINSAKPADADPYYFRGLCYREVNQAADAVTDFDEIIKNYKGDNYWARAFQAKAYTLWAYLDRFEEGAGVLLAYAGQVSDAADAPDAIFEAGRIYERGAMLAKAAETWEQLINTYPTAQYSYRGLFLAAVSYYRLKDYAKARTVFQRALVLASDPKDQAAAYLWVGKTHRAEGNTDLARAAWEQAVQRDPTGYYSQRSAELLVGRDPFTVLNPLDLGYDLNTERPEAETWLRTTFKVTPETNLAGLGDMANDPALLRGEELYRLGRYAEARDEFETLRKTALTDAVQTYRLMNFFLEHNFYRSAILCSRQILDLAGLDDAGTLHAPVFFNHIRFGVYFSDQILEAAHKEGLNPLFLLAVIRQESLFEPFAQSGAGARGLMQIVPATGQELSTQMQWPPNFSDADLDRPIISIAFGARYLSRQRDYFKGSLMDTLAAYNGGPGNTLIWNELSGGDPDLLLETIRADETRTYITQIFEFFNLYRLIYEQKP
jgi:soluble lytic murein transglycosylase